jgi:alpha-L-rhamnosidase
MPAKAFLRARPVWATAAAKPPNLWLSFHASVELSPGAPGVLHIAAAQAYRAWVDGVRVGHGPARAAHGHARVDVWPLPPTRRATREIVIEVLHHGVPTFCTTEEPPFLCAELRVEGRAVLWTTPTSPESFVAEHRRERIRRVERYSYQRDFVEAYRLGPYGFDWLAPGYRPRRPLALAAAGLRRVWLGRKTSAPEEGWSLPLPRAEHGRAIFDPALARSAKRWRHIHDVPEVSAGFAPDQLDWRMHRALAGLRLETRGETAAPASARAEHRLAEGGWLRVDFGKIVTGFPAMRVVAETPLRLLLHFDEILVDGRVDFDRSSCVNAIRLDLAAGAKVEFEAFAPYTLRHLEIVAWSGVARISRVRLRHQRNPLPCAPAPAGLTASLRRVRAAAVESFRQNALDLFMDCAGRERAGWLCDSLYAARGEWHLTGDNPVERAFLENYLRPASFPGVPEGMVPMCYPAEALQGLFIPNWALFFILQLEEARRLRRSPAAWRPWIERQVRGLLRYFRRFENEFGLLENLDGWMFVEWSRANELTRGVNLPTNFLYAAALAAAARLLGEPEPAARARAVRAAACALGWRGDRFADQATRGEDGALRIGEEASEVGQYYALVFGALPAKLRRPLWSRLVEEDFSGLVPANVFVGKLLRLELLVRAGEHARARRELTRYFLPMARETGTLWELFERTVSCNHGFNAALVPLIDATAND